MGHILRIRAIACWLMMGWVAASAATLEQMSLEDLARESTFIVVGRVGGEHSEQIGPLIYTLTAFRIEESLKGKTASEVEVALPGGTVGKMSQRFGGVPRLEGGKRYLIFLWRGPSGRTQITGLSQGLFEIEQQPDGPVAVQRPSSDVVIAPGVNAPVQSDGLRLPLRELMRQIRAALGSKSVPKQ